MTVLYPECHLCRDFAAVFVTSSHTKLQYDDVPLCRRHADEAKRTDPKLREIGT